MRALPLLLLCSGLASSQEPRYELRKNHDPDGTGRFYKDREIAQVMGHQAAGWLERPERDKEEEPRKLLKLLDVKEGEPVADVGAGSGFHTFRIAPLVGEKGKVIAVDIQQEMLDIITRKSKELKIKNVETVRGTETDPKLPKEKVDLILLVDVYHEFSHPYEMTGKMIEALKPGGRLVLVEFKPNDRAVPIKPVHTMGERQAIKEMDEFKELKHEKTHELSWQNAIVFRKQDWKELFNGKDLAGWRANVDGDSFSVVDGAIKVKASKSNASHLFYSGDLKEGFVKYQDFELEAVVRGEPNANSGIFFHTDMTTRDAAKHLAKGYEVQLNSTAKEKRKTGSLYGVADLMESPVDETKWFTIRIAVKDKTIKVYLNDKNVVDYTEPADVKRPQERAGRKLDPAGGGIALQAHDANSVFYFKSIKIRELK
jgi:ubiquinone/menaquinone biosynthesis C-methylase UbiE